MLIKMLVPLCMLLSESTVRAEQNTNVLKQEHKQEKNVKKSDVHSPMGTFFLDRRPYSAPKKK